LYVADAVRVTDHRGLNLREFSNSHVGFESRAVAASAGALFDLWSGILKPLSGSPLDEDTTLARITITTGPVSPAGRARDDSFLPNFAHSVVNVCLRKARRGVKHAATCLTPQLFVLVMGGDIVFGDRNGHCANSKDFK
jgi:hypothetical protein